MEKKDILDDIKQAEKKLKMAVLVKNIQTLKDLAKSVLEAKEETRCLLEEMGMNKDEQKRVIDFINSLVELTDADKKDIRDEVKRNLSNSQKEVQRKLEENPGIFYTSTTNSANLATGSNYTLTANGQTLAL